MICYTYTHIYIYLFIYTYTETNIEGDFSFHLGDVLGSMFVFGEYLICLDIFQVQYICLSSEVLKLLFFPMIKGFPTS